MTEQNGIDILCDAAGSDLLLSSLFPSDAQNPSQNQHPPPQKKVRRSDPSPPAAASVTSTSLGSSSSNHICHICKRVYERADHLTRHLRSHENARPYQCTRCPKRFNRADLLTRHEATHDRDAGKSKSFIRRSDRAAQACEACASAKAKCDDQKPCGRCRAKKLACQASTRRSYQYKTSTEGDSPPSDSATVTPAMGNHVPPAHMPMHEPMEPTPFMPDVMGQNPSMIDPISDDMVYFNPMSNFLQDMDFTMSWDMNFDAFSVPQFDLQGPSPQSSTTNAVTRPSPRNAVRDSSRGHSAFKRSPWLWDPKKEDYVQQQKEGLHIDEQSISQSPAFGKLMDRPSRRLKMTAHQRDRIFSIVLAQNKDPSKVPSFPTLDLLNYLLQAHFVQDEHQFDSWIHPASFDPENTLPELLAAIISSGASFISVPAIWQFGLAMHEVVRLGVSDLFEKLNAHTRNLSALQTFMLTLDVGIWSGFKRKMEIAESFLQPLLTMLRRAGAFSAPADSAALLPLDSDSPEALEAKWKKFISRESYKRLILHLFSHDVQTSISLQRNPLISFSELAFSLPASRDLWCAPAAEAWRQVHHSKTTMPRPLPRVSEVLHCVDVLDELEEFIDIDLCYSAVLNGYWGQVWAYRESVRFFATASKGGTNRLWLKSQHQELYQDLSGFSSIIHTSSTPRNHSTLLAIVVELFLMIMHVSPDEIQRFAGKSGEEESRRAGTSLEENWANTSDARHAIWHAGQVFANAKRLPPASIRGFNAIAVYLASMTLWTYGLFCSPAPQGDDADSSYLQPGDGQQANTGIRRASSVSGTGPGKYVLLDEEETRDTKAFLQFDRGVPALKTSQGAVEPLSDPSKILSIARSLFRENYPVRTEPLPPLVESLGNLLRDLGSGLAGMPSRVASRVQSQSASRMGSEER